MSGTVRRVSVVGKLDAIGPDGVAKGWCWSPQDPQGHRTVLLVSGGTTLGVAVCDQRRTDLTQLGLSDDRFGFEVRIDRSLFPPAPGRASIVLQDEQTGCTIGTPVEFVYPALPTREPAPIHTYLDRVDDEGLLNGWAWCPTEPNRRVRLRFLANGKPVGSTVASLFRGDLLAAGAGDGCHAFSFLLPWEAISQTSASHITLLDDATGQQLNASTVFRRPALRPVEDRLRDAERNVRLLAARLSELEHQGRRDAVSSRAMLGVIGAFFTRLSDMSPEEVPTALVPSLAELLEGTAARLHPFTLQSPSAPVATLCFEATGSLEGVYEALNAVQHAGIDASVSVAILDDGSIAEAALLPSLVQGFRYARLQSGQSIVAARNRLARGAGTQIIAFFSSAVRLGEGWLEAVLAAFERHPGLGVIGSRIVRDDGTIHAFGLAPDRDGAFSDAAAAEDARDPRFEFVCPMPAVLDHAIAIRTNVFDALGGFDESFVDPAASVVDFCLRSWQSGNQVLVLPTPALRWSQEGDRRPKPDADLIDMLAQRWFDWAAPDWPGALGHALLVGRPNDASELSTAAIALQRNGWRVSVIAPGWNGEDEMGNALRLIGVEVLHSPFQSSVAEALADTKASYSLLQVAGSASSALPPERVRELTPQAKLMLVLGELDLPLTPALLDAVGASDLTLVSAPVLLPALRNKPGAENLLPLFSDISATSSERSGICLLAVEGVDDADASWFTKTVWPAIRRQQPGLRLFRPDGVMLAGSREVASGTGELAGAWLAVSPRRVSALNLATVSLCRQAGLPLIVMRTSVSEPLQPGVVAVDATPAAIAKAIAHFATDSRLWAEIAGTGSSETAATQDKLVEYYAGALTRLGLSHSPVAVTA